ncbi:MAG: hypothetical protein ABI723_01200 [Bacteroidia bacterium]
MSITEMKKVIQHIDKSNDDNSNQWDDLPDDFKKETLKDLDEMESGKAETYSLDQVKEKLKRKSKDHDDLTKEERKEMFASIKRAEKGIGTISWEDYKLKNPQWFKK